MTKQLDRPIDKEIELKNDKLLDISKFESYHNTTVIGETKMYFSEFVNSLRDPMITPDKGTSGGFVGGFVDGERKSSNVVTRSLLTIDIDDAENTNVWENVETYSNFAAVLYSTHNSTPDKPRYRLVIPLAKPLVMAEQGAVQHVRAVHYISELLHIGVDKASCTMAQLMYNPTCENEDNYEFRYRDELFFNVDDIPESYELPISARTFTSGESSKSDPREKQSWIGAWCSTYSITEVLDNFLSDVYEPFNNQGRYTYTKGSTMNGAVVYDDLHFHSFHSTDPIFDKNVNAFDLLRLHLFGHLDTGAEEGMYDTPSYKAMIEHCKKDDKVVAHYEENIKYEITFDDSGGTNLQQVLKNRRFEELEKMAAQLKSEWEAGGMKGQEPKKPTRLTPLRCALILPEYITYKLFNLDENTRLSMYVAEEGIYTRNETLIRRVISWLEPSLNKGKADDVIYHLTNKADVTAQTESRFLIPVKNGVFNLETKTLEPFNPEYVFTTKIVTSYEPDIVAPMMNGWDVDSWLDSIACGDKEIVRLLWEVINDAMNGNYSRKKAIFLVGMGNNGKGTFQQLITNLIGMQNIATMKINEFDMPFRLSMLEGKAVVIGDDVAAGVHIEDSSNFNSVVTGDVVAVEFKGKNVYNAVFRCSVIQSTNGMPSFKNKTNGTLRRLVIVPFRADFNGSVENSAIKDEYIYDEKVLQYVLRKAINMDFEQFSIPKASLNELEVFKQDNDPLLDFKLSVFDEWKIQRVPKYVVYEMYKRFCDTNGYRSLSVRRFHKEFKSYLGDDWCGEGQFRYRYDDLINHIGDLDAYGVGFPDKSVNQRSYENVRLKVL